MKFLLILLLLTLSLWSQRIITLSPSLSEIVAGLGKEKDLVGVSAYASYPKSVTKLPQVGGYFSPSLEVILSLKPTLLIGQGHHAAFLEKLRTMGMTVLIVPLRSLDEIQEGIQTIADKLHVSADKTLHAIKMALEAAQKLPRKEKKILITYGVIKNPKRDIMFISGKTTIFEGIIHACGAQNAFSESFIGEPRLRFENLIALNPDQVIMLSSTLTDGHPDKQAVLQAWSQLPINASRTKNIHILDDDYLLIPSHRVALSIIKLCETIQQ